MSVCQTRLASQLIGEHFGDIVEKVCTHLIRNGPKPLRVIAQETGLINDQVFCIVTLFFMCQSVCGVLYELTVYFRQYGDCEESIKKETRRRQINCSQLISFCFLLSTFWG